MTHPISIRYTEPYTVAGTLGQGYIVSPAEASLDHPTASRGQAVVLWGPWDHPEPHGPADLPKGAQVHMRSDTPAEIAFALETGGYTVVRFDAAKHAADMADYFQAVRDDGADHRLPGSRVDP